MVDCEIAVAGDELADGFGLLVGVIYFHHCEYYIVVWAICNKTESMIINIAIRQVTSVQIIPAAF